MLVVYAGIAGLTLTTGTRLLADDAADVKRQVELLQQQNTTLQELVRQQQTVIEKLNQRVAHIEQTSAQRNRELDDLKADVKDAAPASTKSGGFNVGKMNLSGEGGVGFFHSQSEGMFPNAEFRVDEAKLFVEAPVWGDVYFYSELNLATREAGDLDLRLGELYLDFEDASKLWGRDRQLNVRAGRFDIPFGEEYLTRDAIDNPLISHSLTDLWGVDEGIELYGSLGKFSYVAAVQNGGAPGTRDFNADKSVAGRLSYDPTRWLHLSVSGMRTGDVDVASDGESALQHLQKGSYDLALCDLKMPGLNGQQVYERVRATNPKLSERMIFITGDVVNERTQEFLRERNKVCLTKPFSLVEFRTAIKKALATS